MGDAAAPLARSGVPPRDASYSDAMSPSARFPRRPRRPSRLLPTVEETSAGGLVVDRATGEARVAVIARLNRAGRVEWCLPKGHLEDGETPEQAAVREIEEETGIRGRVVRALGTIEYRFSADGRRIHKFVHHYLLEALGGTLTIEGDPDQEAIDVAWVPLAQLGTLLTFPNERRIAREASAVLEDTA